MAKVQELKIAPEFMEAQLNGLKNFEIRKNDRNFEVNDMLWLREWSNGEYTGRSASVSVTFITDYKQRPGYVVLSTRPVQLDTKKIVGKPIYQLKLLFYVGGRMEVTVTRVKKYNATWNNVVTVDGVPVAIAKSAHRAGQIAAYIQGMPADINDLWLQRELRKLIH